MIDRFIRALQAENDAFEQRLHSLGRTVDSLGNPIEESDLDNELDQAIEQAHADAAQYRKDHPNASRF